MKTSSKLILLGLILLVIIAIVVAGLSLGKIAKAGIEHYGPQITKVDVKVDGVTLLLFTGYAKVTGLVVGNPEGYTKAPQAILVNSAAVTINPMSVLSDKIVVKSVEVKSPEIFFEGGLGGNNIGKILSNVSGDSTGSGTVLTNTPKKTAQPSKKIEVDDLSITGAKVHVNLTGIDHETVVTLPTIHLSNLGTGPEGITPQDLTRRILSEINVATLKEVGKVMGDLSKNVQNLGKQAGKNASDTIKSLGGLLKK